MTQRTGIVIVTYNSADEIGPCLDAALSTGADVVVVDNASTDATMSTATGRGAQIIANPTNLGFAAAVNQGIRALKSDYVLLLNPDARLTGGLDALAAACDQPGVAGAGGCLVGSGGSPQVGFMVRKLPTAATFVLEALVLNRLWPGNPVNRRYRCLDQDYAVPFEAEQPAGAFLMIRRDVWQRLGGFDETFYPLWFEDVDFCRRAKDLGFRMLYVPQATALHSGGHSIPRVPLEVRPLYWYSNVLRYTVKHFSPAHARVVCLAVMAGSALRAGFEALQNRSLKPVSGYSKVMRIASRCLIHPAAARSLSG